MSRVRFLLILDSVLFIGVTVLQVVRLTGLPAHEWIGIAIAVSLLLHLVLQWQWITATWRRAIAERRCRAQFNFLLNSLLFVFMTLAILSGLLSSVYATPNLSLSAGRTRIWSDLHSFATNCLVVVVGLHVALNWRWIVNALRLHVLGSMMSRPMGASTAVPTTEPEDAA